MTHTPTPPLQPLPQRQGADIALDKALRKVLVAPAVPDNFRARLMSEVHADGLRSLAERRVTLEQEHALALQQLHSGHVRLQRDTLALVVVAAFTAGTCANLFLPWLNDALGVSGAVAMPLMAVLIGVGTGASVWWDRFGRIR